MNLLLKNLVIERGWENCFRPSNLCYLHMIGSLWSKFSIPLHSFIQTMFLRARILLAALFSLGTSTMAAPTGTTTTITTSTTTSTTPSTHHLHAYLTKVASKLLFETATPTPILHPIVERRNDPHIRTHKDGSLYSDSNTITTTTTTHHNKNNKNMMMMKKKNNNNKKEHTDPLIRISKDGSFRPLNYSEAYI